MPPFKHRASRWPTMRHLTLKTKYLPDVTIGASVSLDTGRPIVDFRCGDGDDYSLTPSEARKMARALIRAADCCAAKSAAAKALRSTPIREESKPLRTQPASRARATL